MTPVNSVGFTKEALKSLSEFIESDLVANLRYFCDYDKQALKDAILYLDALEQAQAEIDRLKRDIISLTAWYDRWKEEHAENIDLRIKHLRALAMRSPRL